MKTVLYAKGIDKMGDHLETIIHAQVNGIKIKTCTSIEGLFQILRKPLNNLSVVILWIASINDLVEFNLMGTLFDDIKIILILPDRKKQTLALGCKLKPSFVSYVDSDLQDVASVLKQILKKTKEKKQHG
ncbi:hypothetical protein [Desulfobacula sp.]|uniref:hypothetical protein n=1 Tax=Desulfobacula sp. TaxID=2593537 RepID=UPI00261C8B85|nr:hypothetical protein [Desulfobacula sp.]